MDVSNRRIVILGKTGAGKSSLANTIFGEKLFTINNTANSGTRECRADIRSVNGRSITLIDTPGFFDTERSEEEMKSEIVRCITECAPGPHAFLIVLKVEKFTKQEQDVINKIKECFSEEVFKYATVVFTHGDQLPEGETIEDFVHQNKSLSELLNKCGDRLHVIDNRYWNGNPENGFRSNKFQVEKLLNTIDEITEANKGSYYTNEMLQVVQEMIEQKKMLMRQSSSTVSEEITQKAKDSAYKEIWIRLAGVGTGAVLGALFGVVVMGGVVVLALKKVVPVAKTVKAAAEAAAAAETAAAALAGATAGTAAGGTAAGGAAGAAAGGANAATTTAAAGAAGVTIKLAGASAAVGAVIGGYTGYHAAEGAETPWEAAEMTATAVKEGAESIIDRVGDYFNIFSKPPDSKLEES